MVLQPLYSAGFCRTKWFYSKYHWAKVFSLTLRYLKNLPVWKWGVKKKYSAIFTPGYKIFWVWRLLPRIDIKLNSRNKLYYGNWWINIIFFQYTCQKSLIVNPLYPETTCHPIFDLVKLSLSQWCMWHSFLSKIKKSSFKSSFEKFENTSREKRLFGRQGYHSVTKNKK